MALPRFRKGDSEPGSPGSVAQFFVGLVATFVAATAMSLAVIAVVVSMLTGWDPVALTSGSMSPGLRTGDIVIAQPHDGRGLGPGTIVVFDDPARPGRITHRIVAVNPDDTYTTKGDAQPRLDSTPLHPEGVIGVARVVVPYVGFPLVWWWDGAWVKVAAFILIGAVTLWMSRWGLLARFDPWLNGSPRRVTFSSRPAWVRRALRTTRAERLAQALHGGLMVSLDTTSDTGSSFAAAADFCAAPGSQTVYATADAEVTSLTPTLNFGTSPNLRVSATPPGLVRALVLFDLPAIPPGCSPTSATLRLDAAASQGTRTIAVYRNSAAWTETGVTWSNMPGYTGTAATATSGTGWRQWTVTDLVSSMYSGSNYGFLVKDHNETDTSPNQQRYQSREGTNSPELIVNWG